MVGDKKISLFSVVNGSLLCLIAFLCLYPMLHVVFSSFSDPMLLMQHRGLMWRPLGFTFDGYTLALRNPNILSGYLNTIFYVVVGTACSLIVTAAGAFVVSRKDAMLARPIMLGVIFTMYFSGGLIPLYIMILNIGLFNTRMVIILLSLVSTWNLIVMRTSFMNIPPSMEESAKIDGAGPLRVFVSIYLPLSKAVLSTIGLFYGVAQWNSWFNHMVFLRDRSMFPLQLIIREILIINDMSSMTGMEAVGMHATTLYQTLVRYAIIVIATIPILFVYPFIQKYFIKGVMIGAVKG